MGGAVEIDVMGVSILLVLAAASCSSYRLPSKSIM